MADLTGRRALVTGGASGIGLACAKELAARGARVTIADADGPAAEAAALDIAGSAWAVDLTRPGFVDRELSVDILVNNAGVQTVSPIQEFDEDRFRFMLDLMLVAPFVLVKAVLPGMMQRGWGRVVNISSVHGLRASAFKSAYVAAKHGLEGLSKVIALEGAPHGVTSNCVSPGYVRTPLVERQIAEQATHHGIPEPEVMEKVLLTETAVKRLIEPREVADLVAWLCGVTAGMVTGSSYTMDGGWSAH